MLWKYASVLGPAETAAACLARTGFLPTNRARILCESISSRARRDCDDQYFHVFSFRLGVQILAPHHA